MFNRRPTQLQMLYTFSGPTVNQRLNKRKLYCRAQVLPTFEERRYHVFAGLHLCLAGGYRLSGIELGSAIRLEATR
jgi:hypothetical protein